ncbi:type IV conjugative transfer system protein TraE [Vibrio vulnificus]|uniref:Type IV conjugative transfer system protein TraE n=2 Tax=Vibrio TaxID=662 RepID=A0AA47JM01_VIBPH|nr:MULTISPECIES: type IV conjugative transfer system protein TraE [Vibrio]ELY5141993.1 type IV conjugative transfer system protein TraE [Vibrio vulnificus]MBE3697047.1 type IV conjugative transfer system protein TraE [Vibrio parahaemolyticus]MBE3745070.1 type IV conjugative transfer system protein TraE [Vibrio parahaemolyticus]MBE3777000.1 type IV conjugative transfer system protein TraE [Vibrio parahaemolyticus]MBE4418191.1 type IV conjugative transfer system protein TraE [Vibrio parahaemolyt
MDNQHQGNLLALSKLLNFLLVFGFAASMLVNVALGLSLAKTSSEKSRTLVPPTISQAFTISDTAIDAPYLQLMGEFFLKLKLNVTPANVTRQYGLLLEYVPAKNWSAIQPVLIQDAEHLKKYNTTSRFDALPGRTEISIENKQFKQTGHLTKTVGDRTLPPELVTYTVQMDYSNGVIELIGIKKQGAKE